LAGNYDLRASLGGLVSQTLLGFELGRGANEKVTLRLEPGRTVTAVVTDGAGRSPIVVPNADVVLAEGGVSSFPIRGRTGSDGKVSLGPIASGPATLGARAIDFVGSALVAVPDVLDGPVQIPLTRGGTIRGEVSDARGFAVDGATGNLGADAFDVLAQLTHQTLVPRDVIEGVLPPSADYFGGIDSRTNSKRWLRG